MRRVSEILFAMLFVSILTLSCLAFQKPDVNAECALTLCYEHGGKPLPAAEFKLYRVADVDESLQFSLKSEFTEYPVDFDDMNEDSWATLANTLQGYVQKDALPADAGGITDKDGRAEFKELTTGLYLVSGNRITDGTEAYTAVPFLVCLPSGEYNSGKWDYSPVSYPKTTVEKVSPGETVNFRVVKKWNDSGNENRRPERVRVELLRDGKTYGTATLSAKENWTYVWNDLDKNYSWNVIEIDAGEYKVEQTKEGSTICLTNTYKGKLPVKPEDIKPLPQTGLLWWPVPVMLFAGILSVIVSVKLRRKNDK